MENGQNPEMETKISYKILKVILYAVLLTPIWVWSGFLFPFITSKVVYLRLVVELAVVFYVPLALKYPVLRPRFNWLSGLVWIYLGVMVITSIFGLNFYKSFWGTVERGEGIITMLHFGAYFTMLTAVLRRPKDWRRYLAAAVIVISFTGLISLGQLVCGAENTEGLCRFIPPAQGERVSATIGNAAFYAAFMLFGVFLSWHLGLESKNQWAKWLFFANAIFNAFLLILTQTRGGAIALYLSVFIVILFQIYRASRQSIIIASALLACLMIFVPLVVFLKPQILPQPVRDIVVVRRLLRVSINDVTTQSRLDTWRASFQGWQDRLLLGYGYENYNLAFNKYFPPRIFKAAGSQIWFDRAHNIVFDVAVTSGVFGLASYFAIFIMAVWILYRLLSTPVFPGRSAVILYALLIGYFVQNLFVFDTHATYLLFFLVLAYLVYLDNTYLRQAAAAGKAYDFGPLAYAVLAVVIAAGAYFVNVRPAQANHFAIASIKAVKLGQYESLLANFQKALSYGTYMDEEIRQHMMEYARQAGGSGVLSGEERKTLYTFVAAELEKNLTVSPQDVKNHLYLMNLYNVTASDTGKIERVFSLGHEALRLSPTRMQIYFELAQGAFLVDREDEGLEYFRKGVALNPQPKESHVNYLMGGIFAKRQDIIDQELAELQSRGYKLTASEEANLANAFAQICDVSAARSHVEAAVRLEPKFAADAKNFKATLEKKCQ